MKNQGEESSDLPAKSCRPKRKFAPRLLCLENVAVFEKCDCVIDEITVHTLEAVDEHTVKLIFSVPPVLVGLHGRVQLRYTSDKQ